ncbi:MAG: VanZ family protein [Lachnospiraceae bacterium]|nr:VanZ family protein [Lachnospiraceae bacterium]
MVFHISCFSMVVCITIMWIVVRIAAWIRHRGVDWKYEAKLLTVYICIVVIARFVYFPMQRVNGRIPDLIFRYPDNRPLRYNLIPFVHLADVYGGWLLNIIGNVLMFIPVGIFWPMCFKKLDTVGKVILVGCGFSLLIELTQLLFYIRYTDVDDLFLNTAGVAIGAVLYFAVLRRGKRK